jgi:sugar O-acyltransferase (sialic acid O-acetyltransferase NeuD family)
MSGQVKVIVIGTGGHAKVVAETVSLDGRYELCGFVNQAYDVTEYLGLPVCRSATELQVTHFIVAVGDNVARAKIFEENLGLGLSAVTAIHPKAIVSTSAVIGEGTLVAAGAIINPFAKIGSNCIINTGAIVEHDCVVGDHVHLAPGTKIAGKVSLGNFSFLGIGTSVIPGIVIGERSQTGAGAVVTKDIPASTLVVGVPARALERKRE